MEIGHTRLGDWMQTLLFGFLAKIARNKLFYYFTLDVFSETLAYDRRGNFPLAEARQTGHLLELGDDRFCFAGYYVRRDFDVYFSQGWVSCGFCHWSSLLFDSAANEHAATYRI
jgi:hypothetical protein